MCKEYGRWLPYIVHLYLPMCNSENGDFLHLPFPGALADQPHVVMELLRIVQMAYRQAVKESLERK